MLHSRRLEAETLLTEVRQAAGAALLDGKPADLEAVSRAQNELTALDAAEAEAIRRERLDAREKAAAERRETRAALRDRLKAYRAVVERAEKAAIAMVDQFASAETIGKDIARLARQLGGRVPTPLMGPGAADVQSRIIAHQLRRIGNQNGYGVLGWNSFAAITDWPEHCQKYVAAAVAPLLQEND